MNADTLVDPQNYTCAVTKACAAPATGWTVVEYSHGTGVARTAIWTCGNHKEAS